VVTIGGESTSARTLLAELLSREAHALDRFLAAPPRSGDWDAAAFFQSRALRLTAAELTELRTGIEEAIARFRPADAGSAPEGASPVRVLAFGFPLPLEAS